MYMYMQDQLEHYASHLRNNPHKLDDMVDECEDYINTLRNIAIEVYTWIVLWVQIPPEALYFSLEK